MDRIPMNNNKRCFLCLLLLLTMVSLFPEDKPDALALFVQKKYAEAEQVCIAEIEETPKNMDSYVVLGWALLAQKKFKEAAKYAELGMKVSRYDLRNLFTAGEAYYNTGENKKALKYLEEYAQIAPMTNKNIKYIYYFMGEIFIRQSEYSRADMAFSTALHFDSKVADWWARLGYAREMAENYQMALEAYDNALKLEPNHAEAKRGKNKVKQLLG
ncbi:MAG: tetratricopeptide repeat protein [Spirochaetales bacterium]|nr:tetratricopeptide repeat protein [Spirochaetales bacterium]